MKVHAFVNIKFMLQVTVASLINIRKWNYHCLQSTSFCLSLSQYILNIFLYWRLFFIGIYLLLMHLYVEAHALNSQEMILIKKCKNRNFSCQKNAYLMIKQEAQCLQLQTLKGYASWKTAVQLLLHNCWQPMFSMTDLSFKWC